jgi:hypothetical protein
VRANASRWASPNTSAPLFLSLVFGLSVSLGHRKTTIFPSSHGLGIFHDWRFSGIFGKPEFAFRCAKLSEGIIWTKTGTETLLLNRQITKIGKFVPCICFSQDWEGHFRLHISFPLVSFSSLFCLFPHIQTARKAMACSVRKGLRARRPARSRKDLSRCQFVVARRCWWWELDGVMGEEMTDLGWKVPLRNGKRGGTNGPQVGATSSLPKSTSP